MTKTTQKKTSKVEEKIDSETCVTRNTIKTAGNIFGVLTVASQKTVAGIFEFDKTLLNMAKNSFTGYVNHGKASMKAKNVSELIDQQVAYAHSGIECTAANARELIDLARIKTEEAYAPVKDALVELKAKKKVA